jgi:HEAT repeat protein
MSSNDPSLGGEHANHTGSEPGLSADALLPKLIKALDTPDWPTRQRAIEALGRTRDPRALPLLLALLHSADKHTRAAAVEALGRLGHSGAVADLLDVLDEDVWPYIRAAAAIALGRIGHQDAAYPLQRAFRDRHPLVSDAAHEGLQMVRHRMSQHNFPEAT